MPHTDSLASKSTSQYQNIMETLKELWLFIRVRKKYWLIPLLTILLIFSLLIVLSSGSALAPFIYSIF